MKLEKTKNYKKMYKNDKITNEIKDALVQQAKELERELVGKRRKSD